MMTQTKSFYVQWEFMGRAPEGGQKAAQAVADAMESCSTSDLTGSVIETALIILYDWDEKSLLAVLKNCSFSKSGL